MIALLLAGGFALVYTLVLTPVFIKLFKRLQWGQFIRDDGPQSHHTKRGTPTMGGIVFISGAVLGYFFGHLVTGDPVTASGLLVILLTVGLGFVGFLDDFTKTRKQRSLGLTGWAKVAGQVVVGGAFAVLALNFPNADGVTPASTAISFLRDIPELDLAQLGTVAAFVLFAIWALLIIVGTSNAVNITDGLDGLASGAALLSFMAYILISFWQFNQSCASLMLQPENAQGCYVVRDPLDLAVIATALCGALIGFLWWNTSPAKIFMGDTGSLGIGGALAALALLSRTELLLPLIGGLFVITTGSVIIQRLYFKITGGKRIFLMSPIHHHFELKGWAEVTIVVRFWIIAGMLAAVAVGLFYAEWVVTTL